MRLAADWLLRAQAVHGSEGYAHSFTFRRGWAPCYAETTGYIVPTMLRAADVLSCPAYDASALRAGEWLLRAQQDDGSFVDLEGRRQVFDTGQILEGLVALHRRTKVEAYRTSAIAAAEFIAGCQNDDGTWTRHAYLGVPHSYYTRVAANLLAVDREFDVPAAGRAATRFLAWALAQARPNGYFGAMEFAPGTLPYLHTVVYVLEGLEASHAVTGDPVLARACARTSEALLDVAEQSDGVPWAQYDAKWRFARTERCLTGVAQWAALLMRLFRAEPRERYRSHFSRSLAFLRARQFRRGGPNVRGALPGSAPMWGTYFRFAIPNWGVKFYLDALLEYDDLVTSGRVSAS